MLLSIAVVVAVVLVPMLHGDLRALAGMRVRLAGLLLIALVIQVLVVTVFPGPSSGVRLSLFLGSYALGVAFLYLNRRLSGLWLVGVGTILNLLAIVANAGVMPATAGALATAGVPAGGDVFANSALVADPRLWFLGDVFAIPSSVPLANVFSVGDVLIALGVGWTIVRASRGAPGPPMRQTGSGGPEA